jgi:hypothetical protein
MNLDFSRPYAEVIGRPGVAYEQDGRNFRVDGRPVDAAPPAPAEAPVTPPQPRPRVAVRPVKQRLSASTALRHQFGEDVEGLEAIIPPVPRHDVLAAYRDPQAADGSMVMPAKAWTDGV